jgi:hypothetical protein
MSLLAAALPFHVIARQLWHCQPPAFRSSSLTRCGHSIRELMANWASQILSGTEPTRKSRRTGRAFSGRTVRGVRGRGFRTY